MVVAAPVGAITTELASNTRIKVRDDGTAIVFNLAGDSIPLTNEAADRLLATLLARKVARDHG